MPNYVKQLYNTECRVCRKVRSLLLLFAIVSLTVVVLFVLPKWMEKHQHKNKSFVVTKANSYLENNVYYVSALLSMNFPDAVVEALESGVAITIVIELEVLQKNLWVDSVVKESSKRFELRYHALTNIYRIKNLSSKKEYEFSSRQEALDLLGNINHAHLIEANKLAKDKHHDIKLRVYVDIWQLPEVLRPVASLSSDWYLKSPWYSWVLN